MSNCFLVPLRIKTCGLQTCSIEYNCGYTWINGSFQYEPGLSFSQKESWPVRFELSVSEQYRKSQKDCIIVWIN